MPMRYGTISLSRENERIASLTGGTISHRGTHRTRAPGASASVRRGPNLPGSPVPRSREESRQKLLGSVLPEPSVAGRRIVHADNADVSPRSAGALPSPPRLSTRPQPRIAGVGDLVTGRRSGGYAERDRDPRRSAASARAQATIASSRSPARTSTRVRASHPGGVGQ